MIRRMRRVHEQLGIDNDDGESINDVRCRSVEYTVYWLPS